MVLYQDLPESVDSNRTTHIFSVVKIKFNKKFLAFWNSLIMFTVCSDFPTNCLSLLGPKTIWEKLQFGKTPKSPWKKHLICSASLGQLTQETVPFTVPRLTLSCLMLSVVDISVVPSSLISNFQSDLISNLELPKDKKRSNNRK